MSIQLVIPTSVHIPSIEAYRDLFSKMPGELHGSSQILHADTTLEWLEQIDKNRYPETVLEGYVPAEQYIAIDNATGDVVGMLNFRKTLNDYLYNYAGHIGYSISPLRRKQGLGTEMLRLALKDAKSFGVDRVLITCTDDNLGSAGVIKNNGGILEDKRVDPDDGMLTRRYWIELK